MWDANAAAMLKQADGANDIGELIIELAIDRLSHAGHSSEMHHGIDAGQSRRPISPGTQLGRRDKKNPGLLDPGSAAGGNLVTGISQCANEMPADEP